MKTKKKKIEKREISHCCEDMDLFLGEEKASIFYNPIYREYFIGLKSPRNAKHTIYNCPWCGFEFPKSLVDEYFYILLKDFKVYRDSYTGNYYQMIRDGESCDEVNFDLPEEFKSDAWWRKRKL